MNYLTLLEQGIEKWNQWRAGHPNTRCSLEGKDLSHGYFFEGNFQGVNLRGVNLQRACLVGANFRNADLTGADLTGAYLGDANFYGANLAHANFTKASLERADMRCANLLGTQLAEVDLRTVKLPDPTTDPYSVEMARLLASKPITRQPLSTLKTVARAKHSRGKRIESTSARTGRLAAQVSSRSRKKSQDIADRQQSIRLSAIPTRQTKPLARASRPSLFRHGHSSSPTTHIPNEQTQKTPTHAAHKSKRSGKYSQRPSRQWGRRQDDQRLAALLGHSVRQKPPLVPALVAAGVAVAIGLPLAIPTIVNSQQQVAAQSAATLALTKSLTGTGQIWAIATHTPANGNHQVIAGESNGNIKIWDGQTGETLQTLTGHSEGIQSIAMSTSGQRLVSSSSEGLNIWNPQTGERIHTLSTQSTTIGAVAITPDEQTFISSDETGSIIAWDMATGQQRYQISSGEAVWDIAIAPNGQTFVSGSGRRVRQWDIATGKALQDFTGHSDTVRSLAISPDGTTLISGSWDQTIKIWNLATAELQTTLSGHTDQIASLAISADGTTLASSSRDRTLKLWDLPSRQLTKTLVQDIDTTALVAFAPGDSTNGKTLISGGSQTINVWQ